MNTIRLFTRNVNKSCSVPSGKGTTIGTVSGPFLTILLPGVAFTLRDVFLLFNHAIVVLARNFCLVVVSPETDDIIDDAFLLCAVVFVVVLAEDDGDGAGVVGVGVRNIIPLFFFFFFDFWTYPRWCIQEDNNKVIGGVFLSQTDRQRNARDDYSRVVSENNTLSLYEDALFFSKKSQRSSCVEATKTLLRRTLCEIFQVVVFFLGRKREKGRKKERKRKKERERERFGLSLGFLNPNSKEHVEHQKRDLSSSLFHLPSFFGAHLKKL